MGIPVQTETALEFDRNRSWITDIEGNALPSEWIGSSITSTYDYCTTYYRDADGDGSGDPEDQIRVCNGEAPDGYVVDATDCDDTDPTENDNCGETSTSIFYPPPADNTPPNLSLIGVPDGDSEDIYLIGGDTDGYICDASCDSGRPIIRISDGQGVIEINNATYEGDNCDADDHGDPVESSESLSRKELKDWALGGIVGYVHDDAYNIVNERLDITLKDERGDDVWVYYNDFIGIYYVPWLIEGTYTLTVEASGYHPASADVNVGKRAKRKDMEMTPCHDDTCSSFISGN